MNARADAWEYRVIDITPQIAGRPGEKVEHTLNEMGAEGWELVATLRSSLIEPTRLYLKRRKA